MTLKEHYGQGEEVGHRCMAKDLHLNKATVIAGSRLFWGNIVIAPDGARALAAAVGDKAGIVN